MDWDSIEIKLILIHNYVIIIILFFQQKDIIISKQCIIKPLYKPLNVQY